MKAIQNQAVTGLPLAAAQAKVFNEQFVKRLQALNDASRWLRSSGHALASAHLQGELPTIQVDASAARLLVAEAHGYNARMVDASVRLCSVILRGCEITWYERIDH